MKIKLKNLIDSKEVLDKIYNVGCFSASFSYDFGVFIFSLKDIFSSYASSYNECVKKYGEPVDENGSFRVKPENLEIATKEIEALREKEIELNDFSINLSILKNLDSLSPHEMNLIKWIIKDDRCQE